MLESRVNCLKFQDLSQPLVSDILCCVHGFLPCGINVILCGFLVMSLLINNVALSTQTILARRSLCHLLLLLLLLLSSW